MLGTSIFAFIFVLGLLVVFHEFGHFLVARAFGVRIFTFAIGFGPKLWGRKFGETEFSLRIIPLGGYVKMAGMGENLIEGKQEGDTPEEQRFDRKPIWQRSLIVTAGPGMNLVLSVLLVFLVFSFEGIPTGRLEVSQVVEGGPAEQAGISVGDIVVNVEGSPVEDFQDVAGVIAERPGEPIEIEIERENERHTVTVIPEWDEEADRALIQVVFGMEHRRTNPIVTFGISALEVGQWFVLSIVGLFSVLTGHLPLELTGPVGIAQMAGQAATLGFLNLLMFAGIISVFLALFNLLPIPVLDGGHLLLFLYEKIKGKPMDPDRVGLIYFLAIMFLILLAVFVTYQDFARIATQR